MTKMLSICTLILIFSTSLAYAHHPAADIVDEDIYAMIDALVADTPHADLVFDNDMGQMTTTITTDSVSAADDLIRDGLLDDASLLDGEVSISIGFPEEEQSLLMSIEELNGDTEAQSHKWSDWGRPVEIKILQLPD